MNKVQMAKTQQKRLRFLDLFNLENSFIRLLLDFKFEFVDHETHVRLNQRQKDSNLFLFLIKSKMLNA